MRRLEFSSGTLFSLTDAAPPPAEWSYAFPDANVAGHQDVMHKWATDRKFHTKFTVFAFEHKGRIILVDAGLGPGPSSYFNGLSGQLPREMREARLDTEAVEHILFTHFHLDHVGWTADEDGNALFPNARYHAPALEIEHWSRFGKDAALPHHVRAFEQHVAPLIARNQLEAGLPGVTVFSIDGIDVAYRPVPGHTEGHCAIAIVGTDETILVAGDTWHSPAQIAVPDWCHRADRDPVMARRSRAALADWAADRRAIVAAGHFPEALTFGYIEPDNSTRLTFHPIEKPQG